MKPCASLLLCFFAWASAFAQQTKQENVTHYHVGISDSQYFSPSFITHLAKEDWQAYRKDSRFDEARVLKSVRKQKQSASSIAKSNDGSTPCFWIAPDNTYIEADVAAWPGNTGNASDNYSEVINLGWSFSYYGQSFNQVVLTSKGTIALGNQGYLDYTPSSFPSPLPNESSEQYTHIAGFWSDFDFSATGSLYYKLTGDALYVNYVDVGYWPSRSDRTNSFQMIICADGSPVIGGGNNVQFYYHDMQFANSQANGAIDGLNANASIAIIGADRPVGNGHFSFGRFNLGENVFNGSYGIEADQQDGVSWLNGKVIAFNTNITNINGNIAPVAIQEICDTIPLCLGETYSFELAFTAPENNQSITISNSFLGSGLSYTIDNMVGGAQLVNALFTASNSNIGVNTVTITATDAGNPVLSTSINYVFEVSDINLPSLALTGNASFCEGGTTTISATPGFEFYHWTNGTNSPSVTTDEIGLLEVFAGLNGCIAHAEIMLNYTPAEQAEILGFADSLVVCGGLDLTICVDDQASEVEWFIPEGSFGSFVDSTTLEFVCTDVFTNASGTYGVRVLDQGCYKYDTLEVIVVDHFISPLNLDNNGGWCNGLEDVVFTGSFATEEDHYLEIIASSDDLKGWDDAYLSIEIFSPGDTIPSATYNWSPQDTLDVYDLVELGVGDSISISYLNASSDILQTIQLINAGDTLNTILAMPTQDGLVWSGWSNVTTLPLIGSWSVDGPNGWSLTDSLGYETTFTPGGFGAYSLCFFDSVCGSNHCYDLEFTFSPSLTISPVDSVFLCEGEIAFFNVSYEDVGGTGQFNWNGMTLGDSPEDGSFQMGPYNSYVNSTAYITLANACGVATDSLHVTAQPDVPEPELINYYLCDGQTILLSPIDENDLNPALQFHWYPDNSTNPTFTVTEPGTYIVSLSNDCDQSLGATSIVTPITTAWITTAPGEYILVCDENEVDLSISINNSSLYSWNWDNGSTTTTITVSEEGEYCWEVIDNQGCGTSISGCTLVEFSATPTAGSGINWVEQLCPGECLNMDLAGNGENISFDWQTTCFGYPVTSEGPTFSFCNDLTPDDCYNEPITITGTVSNVCGSVEVTWQAISQACDLVIPNVITPDGNSKNDYFVILNLERFTDVKLKIFNRWGNLLYQDDNYTNDWYAGDLASGTYYYILEVPGAERPVYDGHLTIIRD